MVPEAKVGAGAIGGARVTRELLEALDHRVPRPGVEQSQIDPMVPVRHFRIDRNSPKRSASRVACRR